MEDLYAILKEPRYGRKARCRVVRAHVRGQIVQSDDERPRGVHRPGGGIACFLELVESISRSAAIMWRVVESFGSCHSDDKFEAGKL